MRIRNLFFSMICFIVICLCGGIGKETVNADGLDDLGKIVDGSVLTDNDEASDEYLPRLRNSYLYRGEVTISDAGSGYVGISGTTRCYVTCDQVGIDIYLEQAKGSTGSFSSYLHWNFLEYELNRLTKDYKVKVDKGYYYRVRAYHYCKEAGHFEDGQTITDGIYI